jgi:hypothetical protein
MPKLLLVVFLNKTITLLEYRVIKALVRVITEAHMIKTISIQSALLVLFMEGNELILLDRLKQIIIWKIALWIKSKWQKWPKKCKL